MSSVRLCVAGFVLVAAPAKIAFAQLGKLFGERPKVQVISTEELKLLVTKQQQLDAKAKDAGKDPMPSEFVLVDVRSEVEVNVSIIPGAITKAQFERRSKEFKGRLVIPYCTVGVRSENFAKKLLKNGFKAKNYQGSILEWVNAELPLVTLEGKPTNRVHTYDDSYRVPEKYEAVTSGIK